MSERIRLDPKAVESAVFSADTESSALIAIYRMVYPNFDDIEKVGDDTLSWPRCNKPTWERICRFFIHRTDILNRERRYDKQVMGGGIWMNNGFTCHGEQCVQLPDWWVEPAPVKLKEKVTA